jgi:predicted DNA-binding transcriptional regulator AlpA
MTMLQIVQRSSTRFYMRRSSVTALEPYRANPAKCGEFNRILDPNYEALRWLIEEKVLDRLEAIFERIKGLETRESAIAPNQCRAIRLPEVLQILAISKSALYDRLSPKSASHDPAMPRPFKLGNSEHSPSVWWRSAVIEYVTSRAQLHHGNGG